MLDVVIGLSLIVDQDLKTPIHYQTLLYDDFDVTIGQYVESDRNFCMLYTDRTQNTVWRWSHNLSAPSAAVCSVVPACCLFVFCFSLACEDLGRMFDNSFPACVFFVCFVLFCFGGISLRTLIPLFRLRSVHSGSASWDDCDRVLPDELRVSSFPDRFPHYAWIVA